MPPEGHEPFLEMVLENPADDGPRMVYADWLEEHGDPRGEFIRAQLQLARLTPRDPAWGRLAERQQALVMKHGEDWRTEVPLWARNDCEFHRGFVTGVHIFTPWRRHFGPELSRAAPVEKVKLQQVHDALLDFVAGPEARHLNELAILDQAMTPEDLRELCRSEEAVRPLRALLFIGMDLMDSGALMIGLCPHLAGLQRLELQRCAIEHRGVEQLAESENLPGLVWLDLSDNELGNDAFWLLVRSPLRPRLARLVWNGNGVTNAACRHLAETTGGQLTHLELAGNKIGDAGARVLRERFPDLAYLNLSGNFITLGAMMELKAHYGERVRLGLPGELPVV